MISKYLFSVSKVHFSTLWRSVDSIKLLPASQILNIPNIEIVRFRKRKGTRAKADAKKKARKLVEASKPPPIPKYLQRKVKISAELENKRCVDENWLETQPIDNVWNMKLYRGKPYSVAEAVDILRGMYIPSLLNDPTALIYMTSEVDLKTKKQTKFVDDFSGIITFPHEFDTGYKNKIIVICKETEDQIKATEAGALYTGSTALIKQILAGTIGSEDFDYVVCHPDIYKESYVLRGILKKKFPNMHNGLLRIDVDRAVTSFIKGVEYSLKRSSIEPDFGWVSFVCGRLDMPIEEIEGNIKHALALVEKHKPANTPHILFNIRTLLWCEKSREKFKIPHWEYLPNYPENGVLLSEDEKDTAENVAK